MPNGDNEVWKWLATTLGGLALGALLMSFVFIGIDGRVHDQGALIVGLDTRVTGVESDVSELKQLIRDAVEKMDRYHEARQ